MNASAPCQKTKVGLVQINNSYSEQVYLPYSVGLLQAYAQKFAQSSDQFEFLNPIYLRLPVQTALTKLEGAQIVAFSIYVWNVRLSLEIARQYKAANPDAVIVMGGPQVPNRSEEFLRKNPFIDLAVHGEGETVFVSILDHYKDRNWDALKSVSYLTADGQFVRKVQADRLKDITVVPSPYLSGVFDPIIQENPGFRWLATWETNRGCPFSCAYCDWGSATQSRVFSFELERLFQEVNWFANLKVPFIFCADANFGILNRDYDIADYVAKTKKNTGFPHTLSVQSTKNATEKAYKVQKLLTDSGLNKAVTISFQSMNDETLKNIKRNNISNKSFQELQRRFTQDQVPTYTDIIIGLPGETYETFVNGVSEVIAGGQHNRISFNNLSILPNAEMGDPEYIKKFGLKVIENEVVYIRGSTERPEGDIPEVQELVIGNDSLPLEDWVRTRAFAWMTNFLHFNKLMQIPFILLHETYSISYRELIEMFMESPELSSFPTLVEVKDFFLNKARAIQKDSDYEFCPSPQWMGIYWPADEYAVIKLVTEGKVDQFYSEAEQLIQKVIERKSMDVPKDLLHDSIWLNRGLLKLPHPQKDLVLEQRYTIYDFYRGVLKGNAVPLAQIKTHYIIPRSKVEWPTLTDWLREVIWYGNKSGAYLYSIAETPKPVEQQIAGHH